MNVSVISHAKLNNVFYKEDSSTGFTQDIRLATRYNSDEARKTGLEKIMKRYPDIKYGMLIYTYIA